MPPTAAEGHRTLPLQPGPASPGAPATPPPTPLQEAHSVAQQHDFAKELALADNDFAALDQVTAQVARAACVLRSEWLTTGERRHLAHAQTLEIKFALLDGLLHIRRAPQEWSSEAGVVSPEGLARVLPLFDRALRLCRRQPQALRFPTDSFHFALAHLRQQVAHSLSSLASGTWQATEQGRQYKQMHSGQPLPPGQAGGSRTAAPDPFARLQADCQELDRVLAQLQTTLPPAGRPAAVPARGHAPQADRQMPPPQPQTPPSAPQRGAGSTRAQAQAPSFKDLLAAGPQAPAHPAPGRLRTAEQSGTATGTARPSRKGPPGMRRRAASAPRVPRPASPAHRERPQDRPQADASVVRPPGRLSQLGSGPSVIQEAPLRPASRPGLHVQTATAGPAEGLPPPVTVPPRRRDTAARQAAGMSAPSRPRMAAWQATPAHAGAGPSRDGLPSAVDGRPPTLSPHVGEPLPGSGPATVAPPPPQGADPVRPALADPAASRARPSSPPAAERPPAAVAGAAVPLPDLAAQAAARLRQEQLAPLRAELDRLRAEARRLADPTSAHAAPAPDSPRWAAPAREFDAWQRLAGDCQQGAERLAEWAHAHADAAGPDHRDAEVRRLQRALAGVGERALAQAARAAEAALAAFAQTGHVALVLDRPQQAGVDSLVQLAAQGAALRQQWLNAPLRQHLPQLMALMQQYDAYETACRVMDPPTTAEEALDQARKLQEAATRSQLVRQGVQGALAERLAQFHRFCRDEREQRLSEAAALAVDAVRASRTRLGEALKPAQIRSQQVAAHYDVLLVGDPWLDPAAGTAQIRRWTALSAGLRGQREALRVRKEEAGRQREQVAALTLPDDAPKTARRGLQAAQAAARQMETSVSTTSELLAVSLNLCQMFEEQAPGHWPDEIRHHTDALQGLAADLTAASEAAECLVSEENLSEAARALAHSGAARLRADLRQVQSVGSSLQALSGLLAARESADAELRQVASGTWPELGSVATYNHVACELSDRMTRILADLQDDPRRAVEPAAWADEKHRLDRATSAMQLRIRCDKALTRGKLLLQQRAARQPAPDPRHPVHAKIMAHRRDHARHLTMELAQINRSLQELAALSEEHGPAYRQQIDLNQAVRMKLVELQVDLARRLPPAQGAGQAR